MAVLKVKTDIIASIAMSPIGNEQKVYYNKHNLFLLHVLQENDSRQLDLTAFFFVGDNAKHNTKRQQDNS